MPDVRVGQIWEDTEMTNSHSRWLVRVMKINEKSVRVEPVEDNGHFTLTGFSYQYRLSWRQFEKCHALIRDDPWPVVEYEGGMPINQQEDR